MIELISKNDRDTSITVGYTWNSLWFSPERAYVILALVPTSPSVAIVVRMTKLAGSALDTYT